MSENSFNANQFDAVTEFPSHLAFMEELLDRYDLDEDTMKKLMPFRFSVDKKT